MGLPAAKEDSTVPNDLSEVWAGLNSGPLAQQRIDHAKKPELMEIGISGANRGNAMLFHHGGDMQVMRSVAANVGIFSGQVAKDFRVMVRFRQYAKGR